MNGAVVRRAGKVLKAAGFLIRHRSLLQQNRRFRDRHKGQRAFILCNGPSVLKQDLLPLRNEIVLSVSSGYLHKNFEHIRPKYHLVPPLTYGMISEEDAVRWFMEMDGRLGEAELFLGSSEYRLVKDHSLFPGRSVNYLCSARPFWPNEKAVVNVCGPVPIFVSVPIMCLVVALYMGFKDIYLLGTEHDTMITREYKYAFAPTVFRGKDFSTDAEGKSRISMYEELIGHTLIWKQYRHIKRIALVNQVNIWNATAGGLLDEFPRVELSEVLTPEN
jgi:hypothetical protein